jgi:ECF sigma factor
MMPPDTYDLTYLLHAWSQGDSTALERLVPLVFEDLRRMARRHLQRERAGHTPSSPRPW